MDVASAINSLLDSFSWEYTKEKCPEMFRYRMKTIQDTIDSIRDFENLEDEEMIPENMILYLLDYIANSAVIESFINECIAPHVENNSIGKNTIEEFYRSIDIYDHQISNFDDTHMVVILTPIHTAASLIQNAYLFISDIVMSHPDLTIDIINDYCREGVGIYDLYRYMIKLILNPLKEFFLYHREDEKAGVPVLIVSSLGTLTADFMSEHAEEFLGKIKANILAQSKALIEGVNPINNEEPTELN